MTRAARLALALALTSGTLPAAAAAALDLPAPAVQTADLMSDHDSHAIAISGYQDGAMDRIVAEGLLHQRAWRIESPDISTLDLLAPLRDQLVAEGYEILFECDDDACGGFDFRFETDVLAAPAMHVDLGDFRYLAARRPDASAPDYVSLLVSRTSQAGYVQMTRVGTIETRMALTATTKAPDLVEAPVPAAAPAQVGDLVADLRRAGRATLADLRFETGSADLSDGSFTSLDELAAYLTADPARRVVLVGHTDAKGTLENNIALSRRRAAAVADRLVEDYGVGADQISAEGIGYLAPLASNATPDGRTQNRRVEAVLLSDG